MAQVYRARILGKRRLASDTFTLQVHAPEIAAASKPGNFIMVRPSCTSWDPITPRPYSIYALVFEGGKPVGISIIVKVLGRGGKAIDAHAAGDELQINGPLGNAMDIEPRRHYLMVAGGTGIAPVAHASQVMTRDGISHEIIYGGRSKDAVFLEELAAFGLRAEAATEDGSEGFHGLVTDLLDARLRQYEEEDRQTSVFACGPWGMMQVSANISERFGVKCLCSLERYMACGFGVCLACVYRTRMDETWHTCCKEGPVVNGQEVNWNA